MTRPVRATKQEVWQEAKRNQLDHFIGSVAKAFPGAIEIVVVETKDKIVWCKTEDDV